MMVKLRPLPIPLTNTPVYTLCYFVLEYKFLGTENVFLLYLYNA